MDAGRELFAKMISWKQHKSTYENLFNKILEELYKVKLSLRLYFLVLSRTIIDRQKQQSYHHAMPWCQTNKNILINSFKWIGDTFKYSIFSTWDLDSSNLKLFMFNMLGTNEWMNERTNEWMSACMNAWISRFDELKNANNFEILKSIF